MRFVRQVRLFAIKKKGARFDISFRSTRGLGASVSYHRAMYYLFRTRGSKSATGFKTWGRGIKRSRREVDHARKRWCRNELSGLTLRGIHANRADN